MQQKINYEPHFKTKLGLMIGGVFAFIFILIFSLASCSHQDNAKQLAKTPDPAPAQQEVVKVNNYGDKHDEIVKAFNVVFSDGNDFSSLYEGVDHDVKTDTLLIAVNDRWNYTSKDVKQAFVKTCFTVWGTATHSRKINFNPDYLHITVVHNLSHRELASWDSVWGTNIKD